MRAHLLSPRVFAVVLPLLAPALGACDMLKRGGDDAGPATAVPVTPATGAATTPAAPTTPPPIAPLTPTPVGRPTTPTAPAKLADGGAAPVAAAADGGTVAPTPGAPTFAIPSSLPAGF